MVYDLVMEPLPFKITKAMLLMTIDGLLPTGIPFIRHDATQAENISQKVLEYSMKNERVWASPTVSIPPQHEPGKGFCFKFPLLKSMLSRNICFYLMTCDESIPASHQLPNVVVGATEVSDFNLKTLLYATSESNGKIPFKWLKTTKLFRAFEDVRGMIDLTVKLQEQADLNKEEELAVFEKEQDKTLIEGIDIYAQLIEKNIEVMKIIQEDGSQWRKLQEQLDRNQDDISRLFKELDAKSQSLKLSAAEVINIKRKIRNMKRDNATLREEAQKSAGFEPDVFMNRPELMAMEDEEVRNKILNIAKAYRDERVRNKELMKTLKMAQHDIANRTKVLASLQRLEAAVAEIKGKIGLMSHEFSKIPMYRDTTNKLESMILRLEGILKTMAKGSKTVRQEFEQFQKQLEENDRLKSNFNTYKVPDNHGEYSQYREQVRQLESEITKLQEDLVSKRPVEVYSNKQVGDIASRQVDLERMRARSGALEKQCLSNNTNYAQQITVLKAKISEKDAMLKAIQKEF